jgi:hypothetical protein
MAAVAKAMSAIPLFPRTSPSLLPHRLLPSIQSDSSTRSNGIPASSVMARTSDSSPSRRQKTVSSAVSDQ